MTPDKVYLQEGFSVPVVGFVSPAWNNPKDKENTVEYIRKDALMEWAKERYKSTIPNVGCYTGHSVWQEVIEHINEM